MRLLGKLASAVGWLPQHEIEAEASELIRIHGGRALYIAWANVERSQWSKKNDAQRAARIYRAIRRIAIKQRKYQISES